MGIRDGKITWIGKTKHLQSHEVIERPLPLCCSARHIGWIAGVRSKPALDARMLVRGVVVHDQVDREPLRDVGIDLSEKA